MRSATGESEPDIDLSPIRELEERLDNFRIQVDDGMTIRGSAWQGYALNALTCEEMGFGGGVIPVPGACCLPDGTCEVVTPAQCLIDGGTVIGGSCVPNPCPTGACCVDTDCSITTEADCMGMGGIYLGNGTTCDPNPCLTGACCDSFGNCSITTEEDCTGVFQGNGTTCDPNPCCCDCGFSGFVDPTHKYKTYTIHVTRIDHVPANPVGCVDGCDSSWDYTSTYTANFNGECFCTTNLECSGGGVVVDCGGVETDCSWFLGEDGACRFSGLCVCDESCFVVPGSGTVISDTLETYQCRYDAPPPNEGLFSELNVTYELSNRIC